MKDVSFGSRYKVLETLSIGGMAEVYKAHLTSENFQKTIVIKKILSQFENDLRWQKSFLNEAKIMSLLNHSHIVQVNDFGQSKSGYFLAMEYVEGGNLWELKEAAGDLSESYVLFIGLEILKGLSYAHKKGVIHRDLSPSNILISKEGEVKLSDFGIAKLQSESLKHQTEFLKGKRSYMSPEQLNREPLTPASDLYSLSVILFELLENKIYDPMEDSETLSRYPYLKKGFSALTQRFKNCEEYEGALLLALKQKELFVTQREFANYVTQFSKWRPVKTMTIDEHPVQSQKKKTSHKISWLMGLLFLFFGVQAPSFYSTGYLSLNVKPWGNVYIEKQYMGSTPLIHLSLPIGEHAVQITNPILNQSKKILVRIEADQESMHTVILQ